VWEIARGPGAEACSKGKQTEPVDFGQASSKGTISWDPLKAQAVPCSIDVHVHAIFRGSPNVEQLDGNNIAVENCQ
jgi:hypothetical protein